MKHPTKHSTKAAPAFHLQPLSAVPDNDGRCDVPQLFRTPIDAAAAAHPLFDEIAAHCRARWPGIALTLEAQCAVARAGTTPGLPIWHRLPASSTGEVAVACLGAEGLLELNPNDPPDPRERNAECAVRLGAVHDGDRIPGDALLFAPAGATIRFASPTVGRSSHMTGQQFWIVLVVRPRDGAPLPPAHRRVRHCARQFEPDQRASADPLPAWTARRDLRFASGVRLEAPMPRFDLDAMIAEPRFAGARYADARERGGPIMQAFLDRMPPAWQDPAAGVIFFGKLDELAPGWAATLRDWHLDGVGRSVHARADGTPDWANPVETTRQRAVCVGPVARTAVLAGEVRLPSPPLGTPGGERTRAWQRILAEDVAAGRLAVQQVEADRVFEFGWGDFHTATRAEAPGWRFFVKATRGRNWTPPVRPFGRSSVVWPMGGDAWPADPLGIFPQQLPGWSPEAA